jgi:hypothetical protein
MFNSNWLVTYPIIIIAFDDPNVTIVTIAILAERAHFLIVG